MVTMVAAGSTVGRWPDHVSGEWTVDLLTDLPDDGLRYEILDGTLLVSPAPIPRHQQAVGEIYSLLRAACPADHRVYMAPLDWQPDRRTSLEPDVLVVRKDRVGAKNITEVLAIAVEVLSPGTARIDRLLKFSRYAEGGVAQYWLVDPAVPSVQIFDLVEGEYRLAAQGSGSQSVAVAEPLSLTVVPDALVAD